MTRSLANGETAPYELLVRLYPNVGISFRQILKAGNREVELDPEPLEGIDHPIVKELSNLFNEQVVIERDAALHQATDLTAALDQKTKDCESLTGEKESLQSQIARLEAALAEATKPPEVLVVSPAQARRALMKWGLLEAVETLVSYASPDVQIKWEYATEFRRDDADLLALFQMLDGVVMPDHLDALFELAASL